jgi:hypothetical protein
MQIIASPLFYFSQSDENAFFSWLRSIPCVKDFKGVGTSLSIEIDEAKLDRECLQELLALYFRFGNDMSVFQKISEMEHYDWIRNPNSYWYTRVFEAG